MGNRSWYLQPFKGGSYPKPNTLFLGVLVAPGLIPPPAPAFAFEAPSFERPQTTLVSRLKLFFWGGGEERGGGRGGGAAFPKRVV